MVADPSERYKELRIEESLRRSYQYPIVCKELSLILRGGYSKFPKTLQSLVFQDTITAFRLLPQMLTETAGSAANNLIQSAEAVLRKQKKILAVKEFKHAKITFKRQSKEQKEEACAQLSEDILLHIFSFLDLRSLLSAASVCWVWNSASNENHLWYLLHGIYFGHSAICSKDVETSSSRTVEKGECILVQEQGSQSITNWKNTFKTAYESSSWKELISYRGYCWNCGAVVWLKNTKCWDETCTQKKSLTSKKQLIKPISPEQIVGYILHGTKSSMFCLHGSSSSSSSENDWDDDYVQYLHQHWSGRERTRTIDLRPFQHGCTSCFVQNAGVHQSSPPFPYRKLKKKKLLLM